MDYNGIITCTKDLIKSPIGPTFGPFLQYGLQVTKTMQAGQEKYINFGRNEFTFG